MDTVNAPMKVVFPPPPPTTNALTTQQRNELLRKTKKLEQLLGAAPHLIDTSISEPGRTFTPFSHSPSRPLIVHYLASVRVAQPPARCQTRRQGSISSSRGSIESFSSCSASSTSGYSSTGLPSPSSITSSTPLSPQGSLRRSSSTLRKPNPFASKPPPPPDSPSYETWSETKPPFLRIATTDQQAWSASCPLPASKRYTLTPSPNSDPEDPFQPPSFNISMGSTRKSKMDRLRRKLGHGIPIELVFPKGSKDAGDNDHEGSSSSDESPVASPTREHLATFVYPPHSEKGKSTRRKSSRSNPPTIRISTSIPPAPTTKGQLAAIIESPDEHGSGCSEEFGLSRSNSSGSEHSFHIIRKDHLDESEIKRWSTRRGYEGWATPAQPKTSIRSILRL